MEFRTRLRGVSPPVVRRLLVVEQASLAEVHGFLQVAFGWHDEYPYIFAIRGWRIGDPARALQRANGGGRVDYPLTVFGLELGEAFRYQYNMPKGWEIDCRLVRRGLVSRIGLPACLDARGSPPDQDLGGPEAYPQWYADSDPDLALYQVEELLDEDLDAEQFRDEARVILAAARLGAPRRRDITERLIRVTNNDGYARSAYEATSPADHRR